MAKFTLSVATLLLVVSLPALALTVQPPPGPGQIALVMTGPWGADAASVAAAAGMPEISPDRALNAVFVLLDAPDDLDRLYASGALFVLNGEAIFALCSSSEKK